MKKKSIFENSELNERCWDGYKPTPGKKPYEKGSCMKEDDADLEISLEGELHEESEHEGKKVTLNKPFRTPDGPKKFSVYVKNDKGNVVKVNFGDPNMEIKRDDPDRRASYRARHNCSDPGPKWKANYWSCKMWAKKPVSKIAEAKTETSYDFDIVDGPRTKRKVGAIVGIKGDSPQDALNQYMKPFGYRKNSITVKDNLIVVKAQWGSNSNDVETHYYKLVKTVSESIPPDLDVENWIIENRQKYVVEYGEELYREALYSTAWKLYEDKKQTNEAIEIQANLSQAAKLFSKFMRSTGAPDKVSKFTPNSKGLYVGKSSKFNYAVDLKQRTVTSRSVSSSDTNTYVWDDKTNKVKVVESKKK